MHMLSLLIVCASVSTLSIVYAEPAVTCCPAPNLQVNEAANDLDRIKALAGEWVRVDERGKPTDEVVSRFRVTAAGSAVIETLFPGTDKEMITLYHQDGDELVLTHYCVFGNQPHMKARTVTAEKIVFICDCTGIQSAGEAHMHQGTLTWVGDDHLRTEWLQYTDGEVTYTAGFEVVRR